MPSPCPYTLAQFKKEFPLQERDVFFKAMGWDKLIDDENYRNTCAMRVSVCLVQLGHTFSNGDIKILKGAHANKSIIIKWEKLSDTLEAAWGKPITIKPTTIEESSKYQGVVVFKDLPAPETYPGHIDVLDGKAKTCLYSSYFGSKSMWVWPAKI